MDGQMAESVDRWTESLLGLTGRARHRLFPPLPPWSLGPYILLMSPFLHSGLSVLGTAVQLWPRWPDLPDI